MLLNRDELVSALFCETDRAQRMKMPLALIAVGLVDDLAIGETWESTLTKATLDEALRVIVGRITRILRCYDSVGRIADGEFILALPGCILPHAKRLAERLRDEVFGTPVEAGGEKMRLNACYGVASSGGRSPLVVLLEVERALQRARATSPGSIQCFVEEDELDPATFLLPFPQDESLRW
jgi:two-component system, cell cycle response regulator